MRLRRYWMQGSPSEETLTKYFNYFWFSMTEGRIITNAKVISVNIKASDVLCEKIVFEKMLCSSVSLAD